MGSVARDQKFCTLEVANKDPIGIIKIKIK